MRLNEVSTSVRTEPVEGVASIDLSTATGISATNPALQGGLTKSSDRKGLPQFSKTVNWLEKCERRTDFKYRRAALISHSIG